MCFRVLFRDILFSLQTRAGVADGIFYFDATGYIGLLLLVVVLCACKDLTCKCSDQLNRIILLGVFQYHAFGAVDTTVEVW